jgi:dephospho-CoA kinase
MSDPKTPEPPILIPRAPAPPPPSWAKDPDGLLKSVKGSVKVGLTGGVASGKSTLDELLIAFGAKLIDYDILSREALQKDSEGYKDAVKLFGPKVVLKDGGELDRPLVAKLIYKDPKLKKALENIVHPYTWKRMLEELRKLSAPKEDSPSGEVPSPEGLPEKRETGKDSSKNTGETQVIVIDVPLLYEADLYTLFSPTALCFATPANQIKRLMARNLKLSERDAKKILKNQWPITEKLRLADYVINNDGDIKELIRQARKLYDRLTEFG